MKTQITYQKLLNMFNHINLDIQFITQETLQFVWNDVIHPALNFAQAIILLYLTKEGFGWAKKIIGKKEPKSKLDGEVARRDMLTDVCEMVRLGCDADRVSLWTIENGTKTNRVIHNFKARLYTNVNKKGVADIYNQPSDYGKSEHVLDLQRDLPILCSRMLIEKEVYYDKVEFMEDSKLRNRMLNVGVKSYALIYLTDPRGNPLGVINIGYVREYVDFTKIDKTRIVLESLKAVGYLDKKMY